MTEIGVIETTDKRYPKILKESLSFLIPSMGVKKLYYKGKWNEDIFENCLAVVGSRHLTSYGRKATEQIVAELVGRGITIVSGFMYGGDEAAHSSAVKYGGRTIAIMPCGIDLIFPPQQEELYYKILENNGLIISEYEPGFKPVSYSFVQRDRLVAGLSKAVFVTEAALNSGSLITANYGQRFGKKIFALPGQITSELAKGTLKLIKEGAEPVAEANDILKFFKVLVNPKRAASSSLFSSSSASKNDSLEEKIIAQLKRESINADDMARIFSVPVSQLGTTLTLMEMRGIINQEQGKYYIN